MRWGAKRGDAIKRAAKALGVDVRTIQMACRAHREPFEAALKEVMHAAREGTTLDVQLLFRVVKNENK
jgi:hypothetical protein